MKTDSLFYRLFQTAPALLFELTGQPNAHAEGYEFRSVEVKDAAFRIDGVFLPDPISVDAPIYFVEVQFQRDQEIYARLFAEVMMFLRQNLTVKNWRAVVFFGDASCEPRSPGAHASLLSLPEVQIVYLDQLAEAEPTSAELALVQLIVAPEESALVRAQQVAQRITASPSRLSASAIIELIKTIMVYKFPQMSWQEVEAMFGISELKQTRVYQQGVEEGVELGRTNEARSLILRQLSRRFGELPESVQMPLNELPLESLEELGEALLDFSTLEDVQGWFFEHHQGGEG